MLTEEPRVGLALVADEVMAGDIIANADAARMLGKSSQALIDWSREGVSGVKLHLVRVGRRFVTSKAEVRRFILEVTSRGGEL